MRAAGEDLVEEHLSGDSHLSYGGTNMDGLGGNGDSEQELLRAKHEWAESDIGGRGGWSGRKGNEFNRALLREIDEQGGGKG